MKLLDLTLPTPAENLALDEALLERSEESGGPLELLRLWESPAPFIVVGASSRVEQEAREDACRRRNVPILRRASGGAAVLAGPGCLMYAVVLSFQLRPELRAIDLAHAFVLETLLAGLRPLVPFARREGTSDLALDGRKFSGNSLRVKREHLLYHGTLLYDFDLALVGELLGAPPRQPRYRADRDHGSFLTNLPLERDALLAAVIRAWQVETLDVSWPAAATARLAVEKYAAEAWTHRRPSR
jgi:lipoate-protein ligase A